MMTRERIQELRGLVGSEFDDELTIDGATAWELLALAEEALVIRESDIADQPAPTYTGPRDWNLKVRISHATTFNGREMGSSSGSWTLAQLHDMLKGETVPQVATIDRTPKSDASCRCGSQWCRFCSG